MKNLTKLIGIIALAAIIGFSFAACDNGTTGGGGGYTPNNSGRDSRLVCTGNEAWVDDYPVGNRDGFIFKADGSFQIIDDYNGSSLGVWAIYGTGSWTTSGNNTLIISGSRGPATYSCTVPANTLRIFDNSTSTTLTKTTVTIGGGGGNNPGGGGGNSTLTITGLPQGEWVVMVFAAGTDISTSSAFVYAFGSEQAGGANGSDKSSSSFPLIEQGITQTSPPWRGSGNREVALFTVATREFYYATVNFSNGSATVPFSNFRRMTD
jgi:hypothetical protein